MVEDKSPVKRTRRTTEGRPATQTPVRRSRRTEDSATTITADERLRMVETAAYFRAERRGFVAGQEAEDWLAAEAEIDAVIRSAHGASREVRARPARTRKPRGN